MVGWNHIRRFDAGKVINNLWVFNNDTVSHIIGWNSSKKGWGLLYDFVTIY